MTRFGEIRRDSKRLQLVMDIGTVEVSVPSLVCLLGRCAEHRFCAVGRSKVKERSKYTRQP